MFSNIIVIARELLFIVILLLIGFFLLAAIPLKDTTEYIENKIRLYNNFGIELELGTYVEFSNNLKNPEKRQEIYSKISKKYDIGTYKEFEQSINQPTITENFSISLSNLFSKSYWMLSWYILFSPLVIFQILRALMWTINKLIYGLKVA